MLTRANHKLLSEVGPGTTMGNLLRRSWVPALLAEELPEPGGAPVRVSLLGEKLVAYRGLDGRVGLLGEHCSHRGASLYFGRIEAEGLRCAYHGWTYTPDGRCALQPNMPKSFKERITHAAYPCEQRAGVVWAWMGPAKAKPALPNLEYLGIADSQVMVGKRLQRCNWMQAMDGDFDTSHVPYLHEGLMVKRANSVIPTPYLDPQPTSCGLVIGARRDAGPLHYYWRVTQWMMPWFTSIPAWPGDTPLAGHAWVPADDEHTWVFGFHWHPARAIDEAERESLRVRADGIYTDIEAGSFRPVRSESSDYADPASLINKDRMARMKHFQDQDIAITESMGPMFDRTKENLGPSDIVIVRIRNRLLAAAKALQQGTAPKSKAEDWRGRPYSVRLPRTVDDWRAATAARISGEPGTFAVSD
ncbi:MAG: Rieske 2Fe-2S domain-containing protein [Burkholderiales bacterium]